MCNQVTTLEILYEKVEYSNPTTELVMLNLKEK